MIRVGIIGFSVGGFNALNATRTISSVFKILYRKYGQNVEIVSGYTDIGIPHIAYSLAQSMGFKTTGIACKKAFDYSVYDCDNVTIVGDNWGDESDEFLSRIDILYKFGGGEQSKREFNAFNGTKKEFEI